LVFSPDSQYLPSASEDGRVKIWERAQDAHTVAVLEGDRTASTGCAWSPDGALITAVHRTGLVELWDAHTFQRLLVLDKLKATLCLFYSSIAFLPSSRWLVWNTYCGWGVWDVPSGTFNTLEAPNQDSQPYIHQYDPRSPRLAISYSDRGSRIWNVETREALVLAGAHSGNVLAMEFSADGRLVLSASHDRTVKVWDAHTGAMLVSLEGHESAVGAACFSPCGKYAASASYDKTVKLWGISEGSCLATLSGHDSRVGCVAFTPDG
ncbi:WD40 repeat-like protein, partial [Dichomitus squalens LYAD-421 SS1]|uniref:WD40 repeat-like protein n=1 Tax=Dichomitus squalens (strain LYAD-421) TaxID=732165 RepID=UPI0004410967